MAATPPAGPPTPPTTPPPARFKTLADHYGVPFLLIHHVRKQGADGFQSTVSGTNGLTGAMDAILVLDADVAKRTGSCMSPGATSKKPTTP